MLHNTPCTMHTYGKSLLLGLDAFKICQGELHTHLTSIKLNSPILLTFFQQYSQQKIQIKPFLCLTVQ